MIRVFGIRFLTNICQFSVAVILLPGVPVCKILEFQNLIFHMRTSRDVFYMIVGAQRTSSF